MDNSFELKHYEVIVGNIGRVYHDNNLDNPNVNMEALEVFKEYVVMSKSKAGRSQRAGRVSGESVWLLVNGELVDEILGENNE